MPADSLFSRNAAARSERLQRLRPSPRFARLVLLAAAVSLVGAAHAELRWERQRILLEPPLGAKDASAVFTFVNAGRAPVRIAEVRSTCGCTAAAAQAEVIKPGEKGGIQATFQIGARTGRQSVTLAVIASEPEAKVYELTLELAIKELATVTPGFVFWQVGDKPDPRFVEVRPTPGVRFTAAESADTSFRVDAAGDEGGGVRIRVTPADTAVKRNGVIRIKLALEKGGDPVEVLAYVRVM